MTSRPEEGFTLVEMLLSVAIITVITAFSVPLMVSYSSRNELDIEAVELTSALRKAQQYARTSYGDSTWGVNIQSGSVTVFKGASYATRDPSYDEVSSIPGSITASGLTAVVFSKLVGLPDTSGTITLTSNTTSTKNIYINAQGIVTN